MLSKVILGIFSLAIVFLFYIGIKKIIVNLKLKGEGCGCAGGSNQKECCKSKTSS